ncbi:hypothetical protein [Pseudoalteromonas phenolica]|uniref:Uncharacterized protein n=1 Tax=Pseudoalteromonas phenolica TaxID=161398 RepID=A0A0S2K490_9GAMM|nr:hypothetical protein [Pseudoalteromonas phenolica]ALO43069.1 hypothetical protein PP2015_2580 [Pseudoalteromonas phenolica]MBE0355781.1 hypothetical protein [Pseudoalteromonas phenolica O-BC30]RXF07145.1 hypothetical protein D9981_00405 [Pseudoalteromonas phenolica O-BC30]
MSQVTQKIQPQWWGKTAVGVFLGLALSYGIVALIVWFGPDGINGQLSDQRLFWKTQFNMWIVTPIWMLIVSFIYMFKTTKQAFISLLSANVIIYTVFFGLRSML